MFKEESGRCKRRILWSDCYFGSRNTYDGFGLFSERQDDV